MKGNNEPGVPIPSQAGQAKFIRRGGSSHGSNHLRRHRRHLAWFDRFAQKNEAVLLVLIARSKPGFPSWNLDISSKHSLVPTSFIRESRRRKRSRRRPVQPPERRLAGGVALNPNPKPVEHTTTRLLSFPESLCCPGIRNQSEQRQKDKPIRGLDLLVPQQLLHCPGVVTVQTMCAAGVGRVIKNGALGVPGWEPPWKRG